MRVRNGVWIVAVVTGCVPPDAPAPTYAERQAAREGPTTVAAPEPDPPWVAQGRENAKRHFEEVAEGERQRIASHEAYCAADRETRRAHIVEYRRQDADAVIETERRQRYAKDHCRRVTKPIIENRGYVDANGFMRVAPVEVSRVEMWKCPPGAPPGIDGNTDVAGPPHGHFDGSEYQQNAQCADVDGFDGGAP